MPELCSGQPITGHQVRRRQVSSARLVASAVAGASLGGLVGWWVVSHRSPKPESFADWVGFSIWLLACGTLIGVVAVGAHQVWGLVRKRNAVEAAGTCRLRSDADGQRADRRRRSSGVAQLIVGGYALLAFLTLGFLAASG